MEYFKVNLSFIEREPLQLVVFKDFFSGAWNSIKGRFRSAKEYIVKGKEAVKRVRDRIGEVKVTVPVGVVDTGVSRVMATEKRSLKELGQKFAVKVRGSGGKGSENLVRLIPGTPGKVTGRSSSKLGKNMFTGMGLS
ncbi:hypothetical protein [Priestia filamentosa]|uniref:hypothetical protein n=1 Tax=Priestia filamentosa TaxID=1402861 RepID=UPI001FB55661|nr:hypothetical protein [Priestia filamentosa]